MLVFKNSNVYVEWRAHWRRKMRDVTQLIRMCKDSLRTHPNGSWRYCQIQSDLRGLKQQARTLQMARFAVEADYKRRKGNGPVVLETGLV